MLSKKTVLYMKMTSNMISKEVHDEMFYKSIKSMMIKS